MRIRSTYFVPVKQKAVDHHPYQGLPRCLMLLLDFAEGLSPAFDRSLLDRHVFLLIQVIV